LFTQKKEEKKMEAENIGATISTQLPYLIEYLKRYSTVNLEKEKPFTTLRH